MWGLRPREFIYPETLAGMGTGRDKSTAFGKAMHTCGESYYTTGDFDQASAPGRALLAGLHYLPHPTECSDIEVELGIDIDMRYVSGGVEPLKFIGFKDLVAKVNGEWYLFDYKSTKSFEYQKRLDDYKNARGYIIHGLRNDLAGATYALDIMQRKGLDTLRGRWVYFKSQGRPEASATDMVWDKAHAKEVLGQGLITATMLRRAMRDKVQITDLDANRENCTAYGGCPYRKSVGGPCEAETQTQFLLGNLIEQEQRTTYKMPELVQLEGESPVTFKIRCARAAATGQTPVVVAQSPAPPGFAAPPPGFMQPPAQAFAPPAGPPPAPALPPPGPAYAPVASHVLPPESTQPTFAPQPAPGPAQTYVPAPPQLEAAPGPAAPTAPAKRKGRPPGSKNTQPTPGSTLTQPYAQTVTVLLELDETNSVEVHCASTEDAQALAGLIQAALS